MERFDGDAAGWDDVLRALGEAGGPLARPHVLQSHMWGAFKSRWGWAPHRFTWDGPDGAAAQVLVRRVAGPLAIGYAPRGPLVGGSVDRWAEVLADLEAWARNMGLAHLKIDPDVPAERSDLRDLWTDRGWHRSPEQIQFANTMHTDLTADEEELLAAMKSKTRYNIRLSGRRDVAVRRGAASDLPAFYEMYADTAERQGFAIRDRAYYLDIWSAMVRRKRAVVILGEYGDLALAGAIPVRFGPTAWYMYGASRTVHRDRMAAYAVQWESMRWAREVGCDRYDWWGGPDALEKSDPMWGVYRFKSGFGADWVPQLGAWDYPARPMRQRLYRFAAGVRDRLT